MEDCVGDSYTPGHHLFSDTRPLCHTSRIVGRFSPIDGFDGAGHHGRLEPVHRIGFLCLSSRAFISAPTQVVVASAQQNCLSVAAISRYPQSQNNVVNRNRLFTIFGSVVERSRESIGRVDCKIGRR